MPTKPRSTFKQDIETLSSHKGVNNRMLSYLVGVKNTKDAWGRLPMEPGRGTKGTIARGRENIQNL